LGRGGSDTTAVVLAAALGAAWCEICSDVDGVYTADPRVVSDAVRHDQVSLDAALALARGGAKVLLADALAYAKERGVALRASATKDPPGTGTLLVPGPFEEPFVGVTSRARAELFEADDAKALARHDLPVALAWRTGATTSFVVPLENLPERAGLVLGPGLRSLGEVATVTIVGTAVTAMSRELASALDSVGVGALHAWLAGDGSWTAVLRGAGAEDAVRRLHLAFRSKLGKTPIAGAPGTA
jgi:aspartate kinase